MKLTTRTKSLSIKKRRQIVDLTVEWMKENVGRKVSKERTFKYAVRKLGDKFTPAYGMYCPERNTMYVFHNYCPTVKWIIRCVLHEYTHYLQNLRYYSHNLEVYGYMKHPQEKHARNMETLYQWVWDDISPLL